MEFTLCKNGKDQQEKYKGKINKKRNNIKDEEGEKEEQEFVGKKRRKQEEGKEWGEIKNKIKMGNKTSIEKRRCCLFGPMIPCKQSKKRNAK